MSMMKRLEDARQGYYKKDATLSAAAHDPKRIAEASQEKHGGAGHQYLGDMVYGGLDGIVTTFAVVSGVAGASLGANVILILGMANLLADGFSMGVGAYLSAKSDKEYYDRERGREKWEAENFPEGERAELYELYLKDGYSPEDASQLVAIQSKDTERWVDTMMVHELGLLMDEKKPHMSALATFIAFVIAGALPLVIYLLGLFTPISPGISFPIALVMSGIALFALGAAKVLVTGLNPLRSGLEMLIVGGVAAGVAYLVGALLKGIGG